MSEFIIKLNVGRKIEGAVLTAAFTMALFCGALPARAQTMFAANGGESAAANTTGVVTNQDEGSFQNAFKYVPMKGSDDINVQFYMTCALALAAGFDTDTATSIGLYNQYVDDNPRTSPVRPLNFQARRDFHFTSEKRRAKLWQNFLDKATTASLAAFLHAEQDSYFHAGYNYVIGHLYKGVRPDQTWRPENLEKAKRAAADTYEKLTAAVPFLSEGKRTFGQLSYADLESQVIAFLRAADDKARGQKFAVLLRRITILRGDTGSGPSTLSKIHQIIERYSVAPKNWQNGQ